MQVFCIISNWIFVHLDDEFLHAVGSFMYMSLCAVLTLRKKTSISAEYGIAGHAVSPGACHFTYSSKTGARVGFINSPFYPDHYPANRTCRYDLVVTGAEFVRLSFLNFHTADGPAEEVLKKEHHTAGMRCTRVRWQKSNCYFTQGD